MRNNESISIILTMLGKKTKTDIVWIYRSLQLLTGLLNIPLASSRFACHSAALLTIFVVASFTLIKNGQSLFSGDSLMALPLASTLGTALCISVFVFYVECYMVDELEAKWKKVQK